MTPALHDDPAWPGIAEPFLQRIREVGPQTMRELREWKPGLGEDVQAIVGWAMATRTLGVIARDGQPPTYGVIGLHQAAGKAPKAVRALAPAKPKKPRPAPKPRDVAWKSHTPASAQAIADALEPEEEKPMTSDWMTTAEVAEVLGIGVGYVKRLVDEKDCRRREGVKGKCFEWRRVAVEKAKAAREDGTGPKPTRRKAVKPPPKRSPAVLRHHDVELSRAVRWHVDGVELGKLTAEDALRAIAELVGA